MNSIDIFAETNPAFCALVLLSFCTGYEATAESSMPFPLLIFPIPIILSGDLTDTFEGTNVNTGFFSWVKNNPSVSLDLSNRIEESRDFVKPAIEFAFRKQIISFKKNGEIQTHIDKVGNYLNAKEVSHYFKRSNRLGSWMGNVKSVKTIFNHLGIQA